MSLSYQYFKVLCFFRILSGIQKTVFSEIFSVYVVTVILIV